MDDAVTIRIIKERPFDSTTIANELHKLAYDIENSNIYDADFILRFEDFIASYPSSIYEQVKNFKIGHEDYTFLHHAAKALRPSLLNYLINKLDIPIDSPSKSLMTPLHVLVKTYVTDLEKFKSTFDVLIQCQADINAKDESQLSVLQLAILKNNFHAVLLILSNKNLRVTKSTDQVPSPLHIACKEGYDEIAFSLIDYLSANAITDLYNHDMPIHLVLEHKTEKLEIAKRIFEKLSTSLNRASSFINPDINLVSQKILFATNHENRTILQMAIENGHTNIAEMILSQYYPQSFSSDANGNMPVHLVAESGNIGLLDTLSKLHGVAYTGNSSINNPLHLAAAKNRSAFITAFLELEKEEVESDARKSYIPCVMQTNENYLTPLFLAVLNDHVKCVEALLKSSDEISQLDVVDRDGNSVIHICAKNNSVEILRHLIMKHPSVLDSIFIVNNAKELPLHIAASLGHIEIFKLILQKFIDGSLSNLEKYLCSVNDKGKNCFHLMCENGHSNIAEYLINDLKHHFLIEIPDGDNNTPLHLAAMNGYPPITELLTTHKADITKKNSDRSTALDLSCHKKYFDVSKIIIDSCETLDTTTSRFKPLHIASKEGAYEIVELLLKKGVHIDSYDEEGMNALDIAIENNQKDVIKVLLSHTNWKNLFETKPKYMKLRQVSKPFIYVDMDDIMHFTDKIKTYHENPQLVNLFEKKMWNVFQIILDNSSNEQNGTFDFTILNPPLLRIENHPLMLIARSGQETLLKHKAVKKLLSLKWFIIPRLIFYAHLLFYFLFIAVFGLYSMELTELNFANSEFKTDIDEIFTYYEYKSYYYPLLILVLVLKVLEMLIFIFIVKDGFKILHKHVLEITSFVLCSLAVFSLKMEDKTQFTSLAILVMFVTLASKLQKVPYYGIYVLAFKRTMLNSARFLPIFLLSYIGFLLTFRVRSDENMTLFTNQTVSSAFIKGLTMALGDFDNDVMGYENNMTNYILYLLFIGVMTIIILNLLVGIAVGEISQTLEAADIQQISMKITYCLKVQKSLQHFTKRSNILKSILNMDYSYYRPHVQNRKIKNIFIFKYPSKAIKWINGTLVSKDLEINLANPQTRLEESIANLSDMTSKKFELIGAKLEKQTLEVQNKLAKSKQRLEDNLTEMSRKTHTNFEQTAENSSSALTSLEENLKSLLKDIQNSLVNLDLFVNLKFAANRRSIIDHIKCNNVLVTNNFRVVFEKLSILMKVDINEMYKNTTMTNSNKNDKDIANMVSMLTSMNKNMNKLEQILNNLNEENKKNALEVEEKVMQKKAEENKNLLEKIEELIECKIGNVSKRDSDIQRIIEELYDLKLQITLLEPVQSKPSKQAILVSSIMEEPNIEEATVYKTPPRKKDIEIPAIAEKIQLFNQPDWSKINEINERKDGKDRRRKSMFVSSSTKTDEPPVPPIQEIIVKLKEDIGGKSFKRRSTLVSEEIPTISEKLEFFKHPDSTEKNDEKQDKDNKRRTSSTNADSLPSISEK